jgi:SAM-dependent methyltransferase
MRAAAERLLAGYPNFRSVSGTAEATGLPAASVDWVIAGQAFHWFDVSRTRAEAQRILRPSGRVALFWNNRLEHTPFLREYESLLCSLRTDYCAVKHQNAESDGRLEQFFAAGRYERRAFANQQSFDRAGLLGRAFSSSYVPPPGDPRHADVAARLGALFERHAVGGRVAFEYETRMYVGRV